MYFFYFIFLTVFILVFCFSSKEVEFSGITMGTRYTVQVVTGSLTSTASLKKQIETCLFIINKSVSIYDPLSEISLFNLSNSFSPTSIFLNVLKYSKRIYELTDGVLDPTICPVVNSWKFQRDNFLDSFFKFLEIDNFLGLVGLEEMLLIDSNGLIVKNDPNVSVDFSSIAKGFGVDQISRLLVNEGFKNFFVEIGGEIYASGCRKDGDSWLVGMNYPEDCAFSNDVYKVISLSNKAVATSGKYRNFVDFKGKICSHIIDPRNGNPVTNQVVSVSVIADNCTMADGLATALVIVGPESGLKLINGLPAIDCIITVVNNEDSNLKSYISQELRLF